MKPVVQQEISGCGIASAAAIAGLGYQQARLIANQIGIFAQDRALWSDTAHVRRLLRQLGHRSADVERPFVDWDSLPNCALLAIKWHLEAGVPFWHWVVFRRDGGEAFVLDSKQGLKRNRRTDFGRMKPKWFIEVMPPDVP